MFNKHVQKHSICIHSSLIRCTLFSNTTVNGIHRITLVYIYTRFQRLASLRLSNLILLRCSGVHPKSNVISMYVFDNLSHVPEPAKDILVVTISAAASCSSAHTLPPWPMRGRGASSSRKSDPFTIERQCSNVRRTPNAMQHISKVSAIFQTI